MKAGSKVISAIFVIIIISSSIGVMGRSSISNDQIDNINSPELTTIDLQIGFDPTSISLTLKQGYSIITTPDSSLPFEQGAAAIPFLIYQVLIHPAANDLRIETTHITYQTISLSAPLAGIAPFDHIEGDGETDIEEAVSYPEQHMSIEGEGWVRGMRILDIRFDPIIMEDTGYLSIATFIEAKLVFEIDDEPGFELARPSLRSTSIFRSSLEADLLNPQDIERFPVRTFQTTMSVLEDDDVQFVLVTDTGIIGDSFDGFVEWKNRKGVPTRIVEMSFINSNYNGTDKAEKLRNFLIDAMNRWDTEIVLLGGDTSVVPYRGVYVKAYSGSSGWVTQTAVPSDLYFSDLDGTWNADNDSYWGEVEDNIDMKPDLYVGRASVQTENEADTFVLKTLTYEKDPPKGYLDNATFAGEYLDSSTNSSLAMDLLKNNLFPPNIVATSLYDSQYQKFGNLNRVNFMGQIDKGTSMIFHAGHCNWNVMSVGTANGGSMYNSNIPSYSGGYKLGVLNTVGCIANKFSQNDAIVELHVMEPDGGTVAGIGNSHYGWYSYSSPGYGPSERVQYKMVQELFNNDHTRMAEHFAEGKEYFTSSSGSYGSIRWVEMVLNLIGDPEVKVRTMEPIEMNVSIPGSIGFDYPALPVTVFSTNDTPLKGALVCLEKSDYYAYGLTDASGKVFFDYSSGNFDKLNVTVTAWNHLPIEMNLTVDIVAPSIIMNSDLNATTGDPYRINCTAFDASGLDSVIAEFEGANTTLNLTSNDGSWVGDLDIPLDSIEPITIRIRAMDRSGNINITDWMNISVTDNDDPSFVLDETKRETTTGDPVTFKVMISDNIGLEEVEVEFQIGEGQIEKANMMADGSYWTYDRIMPIDKIGERTYSFSFKDLEGNQASSPIFSFSVNDDERPVFIQDLSDSSTNTSSILQLRTVVEDNIAVSLVTAEWWADGWHIHNNDTMEISDGDWILDLEAPEDELKDRHYIFHACDDSGNWNSTEVTSVPIIDGESPRILTDGTPNIIGGGEDLRFQVTVTDNIGVVNVTLFHQQGTGPSQKIQLQFMEGTWQTVIPTSVSNIDDISYRFVAFDLSGNSNGSVPGTISVKDVTPPEIHNISIPSSADAGTSINVSMTCFDNIMISATSVKWWFGGEDPTVKDLVPNDGIYLHSIDIPLESFGTLYVTFSVSDAVGNSITSGRYSLTIIEFVEEILDKEPGERIPLQGEDLDKDGMDDLWEYENGLDPYSNDSLEDKDGDGYDNLREFIENTSPGDPQSHPVDPVSNNQDLLIMVLIGSAIVLLLVLSVLVLVIHKRRKSSHLPPPPMARMISDNNGTSITNKIK